jgi:hypothetical protein
VARHSWTLRTRAGNKKCAYCGMIKSRPRVAATFKVENREKPVPVEVYKNGNSILHRTGAEKGKVPTCSPASVTHWSVDVLPCEEF